MVLNVYRNGLLGTGRRGEGCMEVGEEGRIYTYRYSCHHQNDFCIKVGSDESLFNVS